MQDSIPWYRFSTSGSRDTDPGEVTEAVGDADPVKSTSLGLRNIRRTMNLLMPAAIRPGEDNAELSELYDRLIDQWVVEMEHVVNVVGGSNRARNTAASLGRDSFPLQHRGSAMPSTFWREMHFKRRDIYSIPK